MLHHQWPPCDQDSDLDATTALPQPPTLHCMCLIANIKRNDFFFDLSTSDKSNSVPQTGGNTLLRKNSETDSGTSWRHPLNQVCSKRCPPSSAPKQDISCRALTQSEKNWPSPDMTLSQDALGADMAHSGTGAPLSCLQIPSPFPSSLEAGLCLQVGPESPCWPARHGSRMSGTSEGSNGNSGIALLHLPKHLFYLPQPIKHHGLRGQVRAFCVCLTHNGADLMEHSFNTSLGGSVQSAN